MSNHNKKRTVRRSPSTLSRLPLTVAIYLAVGSAAFAQEATPAPATEPAAQESKQAATLDTVTVTAQKRVENLQRVPISMQVIGAEKLDQLNITDFDDYAKYLPSVSFQTLGPGFAQVYMRGVASGGDGNHSGSLPSVGMYLDEQPITTIQGPLDIHLYDIARVESLAGPQGTLYGASSQAGTIRIITNKPDASGFSAGYGLELNSVSGGGIGHVAEGFVNIPLTEAAAIRMVGWNKHDAGYIDNVFGTRTYPSWDDYTGGNGTVDNADFVRDDYNEVDTTGARLALKVDLNDAWSIGASVMGQKQVAKGSFGFDPVVGDLALSHYNPERSDDRWTQAALTVEGKVGNFDLTYAFAHLKRDVDTESDYSDYAFWYDTLFGSGAYFYDNTGAIVNPSQYIQGVDGYKKTSHELRISSPQDRRFRFVAGLFMQDQRHNIEQNYRIDGIGSDIAVPGWPGTIWLTQQVREDNDEAIFGQMSYDFTDKLTGTLGGRYFRVDNSLVGFFGYGAGFSSGTGEAACFRFEEFRGAPCVNLDKRVEESGTIGKANLTYQINDNAMIYGTWSEGFRPGGINRRGTLPPYLSDYLTNYEFGWKTSWMDNRLTFNGAAFRQEWEDFQFSILGANGLTEIKNANQARINGLEMDLNFAATYNLQLTAGMAFYDAKLTANYCGLTDLDGKPLTECVAGTINPDTGEEFNGPEAPSGTQLPITPEFKGNLIARYTFDVGSMESFVQGALVYVGERESDLRLIEREILGKLDAYTTFDLSAGIRKNNWSVSAYVSNLFDERADLSRFTQCGEQVCGAPGVVPEYPDGQVYTITNQPRTFGIRFSQDF